MPLHFLRKVIILKMQLEENEEAMKRNTIIESGRNRIRDKYCAEFSRRIRQTMIVSVFYMTNYLMNDVVPFCAKFAIICTHQTVIKNMVSLN